MTTSSDPTAGLLPADRSIAQLVLGIFLVGAGLPVLTALLVEEGRLQPITTTFYSVGFALHLAFVAQVFQYDDGRLGLVLGETGSTRHALAKEEMADQRLYLIFVAWLGLAWAAFGVVVYYGEIRLEAATGQAVSRIMAASPGLAALFAAVLMIFLGSLLAYVFLIQRQRVLRDLIALDVSLRRLRSDP